MGSSEAKGFQNLFYESADSGLSLLTWRSFYGERSVTNLTNHIDAEKGLRASEEKYRSLVETTGSGYVILDVKGTVLDANAEFVRLTGRERLEDVCGHSVLEWTAPYDIERNAVEVAKCFEQGYVRNLEVDYISPHGRIMPVEINATIFRTDSSPVILTLCRDITVRRQKEILLREQEQHLRLLTENMMDVISQIDADLRIIYCSPSSERMLGYIPSDLIGHSVYEHVYPEDIEWLKSHERQAIADKKPSLRVEYRYRNLHGDYIWLESTISILFNPAGEFRGAIICSRDIAERIKAEESALGEKSLLSSIFRASPWGIGVVKNRILKAVNDRICEMTGYAREELIGQSARILYPTDSDYKFVGREKYSQLEKQNIGTVETRWQHKNGQIIDILLSSSPIYPPDLSREVTFTVLDISSRKKAEAEREKLQAQLLQSQRIESIGRLAGGVAHDFNNMLSVIIGQTELALMQTHVSNPVREGLKEIKRAAERSADLTRQLLTFARKQVISPVLIDLNDIVTGMLKMLRRIIGENIELSWNPGINLWPVKIDPIQIDQILANLTVNARDAISGVGKITIETTCESIDETYCVGRFGFLPGEYVVLTFSDTGQGMTKDVQEHLFEPFFTTKSLGKGTGLGLATVYGIVKQNKGYIYVYSELEKGTTFKIYFPRSEGEKAEPQSKESEAAPCGHGETILLVEDEEAVLNLSKTILENQGYFVLSANDPEEALRVSMSYSGKIHLLITDLIMPKMNGTVLATKLQAARPDLACLYVSGYAANIIMPEGMLNSGVNFLSKPFRIEDLCNKVREILKSQPRGPK
jgi:two-component system, cell cycle sensor histidine kinase and response regulator CckA